MKQLLYICIFVLCASTSVFAQKPKVMNDPTHDDKPIHFGFCLGLNYMDFAVYQTPLAQQEAVYAGLGTLKPGINIQAIANLRLTEDLDLRSLPGISFGERHINYIQRGSPDSVLYDGEPYRMESSFIELPLLIKYKARRVNNFRPYLIGGGNLRYDLAVKKEYDRTEQLIMLNPIDVYVEMGMGFDFYLNYFKLGVELKYSMGMSNVFSPTDRAGDPPQDNQIYTDVIDKLKSRMFIISFHFE